MIADEARGRRPTLAQPALHDEQRAEQAEHRPGRADHAGATDAERVGGAVGEQQEADRAAERADQVERQEPHPAELLLEVRARPGTARSC